MSQIRAWIGNAYAKDELNRSTIEAQVAGSCVNVPSAYVYRKGTPKILWYEKSNRTYRLQEVSESVEDNTQSLDFGEADPILLDETAREFIEASTFALEAHLRDYLVLHLSKIEKGLQLWCQSPPSVEYVLSGRRIDILAKDLSDTPVVVELKLNRGYDRVVGQALLYQGLVATELNVERVRVILIASEITEELKIATRRQPDIDLFEYALMMELTRVSTSMD